MLRYVCFYYVEEYFDLKVWLNVDFLINFIVNFVWKINLFCLLILEEIGMWEFVLFCVDWIVGLFLFLVFFIGILVWLFDIGMEDWCFLNILWFFYFCIFNLYWIKIDWNLFEVNCLIDDLGYKDVFGC